MVKENWRIWDSSKEYGNVFFKRATGILPQMECSKALAKIISTIIQDNDLIVDVGCGTGHYIPSLDKEILVTYKYLGLDATKNYINLAKKAFKQKSPHGLRISTSFKIGDIYKIKLKEDISEIVMCNNVLLHLPSIVKPVQELWRIAKKYLIIRTLIGTNSFRIKQINEPEEYTKNGEPLNFHYHNIYSEDYLIKLFGSLKGLVKYEFREDKDFSCKMLNREVNHYEKKPHNLTSVINGMQINNYIIQPWKIAILEKKNN
ncbi:MAG: methylase/methyltransferase [uncultured bacterium]|nr:MAG: methylase/methyltransferase [uncultured bacterium]